MKNNGQEKWLFFSNRTQKSAMIMPQLRRILGLNFVSTYTRENNVKAPDIMGRIDRNTICNYLENPRQYQYYICGSDKMMKDITKVLRELGVAKKSIHTEAFSW